MDRITDFISLFSLFPVQKAFIAFLVSGTTFPLIGVFAIVMNLIPLRFALMHGALLGGVVGLVFGSSSIFFPLLFCCILIAVLGPFSDTINIGLSNASAFLMITTVAVAFILIDKTGVSSMDAFSIFWGNVYALSLFDLLLLFILSILIIVFITCNFRKITALLYDRDIARSTGINATLLYYVVLFFTGFVVALSVKTLGAMLVDSILLLPAMGALYFSRSIKKMFINAALLGFASSLIGFFFSLVFNLQPSASVTVVSVAILGFAFIKGKFYRKGGHRA